jgi:cyclase
LKRRLFLGAGPEIFANAKRLRYNLTAAESLLWNHLKSDYFKVKFRRQHPLGQYIADFYCHQHKLVIEVDGGIHSLPEIALNDLERQRYLESAGLKVLRFTNDAIFKI